MVTQITTRSSKGATIAERFIALRRRTLPMTLVLFGVLLCALLAAFFWPPTYKAGGTILIEQQELPVDIVRSTISSFADQRLQVIKQRVITTDNLLRIIQRYDLYAEMRRKKVREVVIDTMRKDIQFALISADVIDPRSGHPTKATIAFSVSYSNRSPELAAKVANELVSLFLQENLDNRKQRSADATNFLNAEADRLAKQIEIVQRQLATYKEQHLNDLPELAAVNIQSLNRAEEEKRDVDTRLASLEQQLVYLDAQLAQLSPTSQVFTSTGERVFSPADRLKFLRTELARTSALYSPTHPDVLRYQREIAGLEKDVGVVDHANDLDRQATDAAAQLASAKDRYGAEHPDVVRLERVVAALTVQQVEARTAPVTAKKASTVPDNPAYVQVMAQREVTASERASLQNKRVEIEKRVREMERRLESAPGVEREYTALLRESDNTQLKYRDVRQKQMEAQVSENLETERKGERFTLIEPPTMPGEPASPNRTVIVALGFVLSLGAAVGIALLLEMLDTSVRGKRDLEDLLQVPTLAVLPWITTHAEKKMRMRRRMVGVGGSIGAVLLIIISVHIFYRPLDVLWEVALRRLG